jgi:NAD(P)-dependent dehydrogenase (short-subunit alcohol dehydrogenase family)
MNPVAIVTGASRGIGRAVAAGLAVDGFELALVARGQAELEQLAAELPDDGGRIHSVHVVDVSDPEAIEVEMAGILARRGRVDVLVNNAGAYAAGGLGLSAEEFDRMIRVNLVAPFLFMKAALPVMKAQGSGHVFNLASRAGLVGFAGDGGYVAGKFGLVGLSASVYREYSAAGIGVTAICPGWTDTVMAAESGTPLAAEEMIQPADILETVRWLLRLSPAARVREVMLECRLSIS